MVTAFVEHGILALIIYSTKSQVSDWSIMRT